MVLLKGKRTELWGKWYQGFPRAFCDVCGRVIIQGSTLWINREIKKSAFISHSQFCFFFFTLRPNWSHYCLARWCSLSPWFTSFSSFPAPHPQHLQESGSKSRLSWVGMVGELCWPLTHFSLQTAAFLAWWVCEGSSLPALRILPLRGVRKGSLPPTLVRQRVGEWPQSGESASLVVSMSVYTAEPLWALKCIFLGSLPVIPNTCLWGVA